jgi:hypothetical protein
MGRKLKGGIVNIPLEASASLVWMGRIYSKHRQVYIRLTFITLRDMGR